MLVTNIFALPTRLSIKQPIEKLEFEKEKILKNPTLYLNPLPDDKILDWSKLQQSADDNFEFAVNSRKFSKLVENTVGKGEIARYEQFLLFP